MLKMPFSPSLQRLKQLDIVRELDLQFARFIQEQEQGINPSIDAESLDQLGRITCLLSYELSKGNVCLDLNTEYETLNGLTPLQVCPSIGDFKCVANIIEGTQASKADLDTRLPLVLDHGYLYLHRYWFYEIQLADQLNRKCQAMPWVAVPEQMTTLKDELHRLFNLTSQSAEIDWQAVAACITAMQSFSVISGGPGTGKTTTVIRLLALLCSVYPQHINRAPIVKLAAPTGKAAMRLSESIKGAKANLEASEEIKQAIPEEASTLHRLLKQRKDGQFQHNANNPLHLDVLIVDEASMVDLPMMAKLLDALPEHCQLILLGDKDQLASVEAGSVLGDICDGANHNTGNTEIAGHGVSKKLAQKVAQLTGFELTTLQSTEDDKQVENAEHDLKDHICQLHKSYRFHENSGIGHLARAANHGDRDAWQQVIHKNYDDLNIQTDMNQLNSDFMGEAVQGYTDYLNLVNQQAVHETESALAIHSHFNQFKILCAVREGDVGVDGLNNLVEQALIRKGLLMLPQQDANSKKERSSWYAGRPIMVMENDYNLNLFNGDIGIALPVVVEGMDTSQLKVSFVTADGEVRWVKPSRLPKYETVYAMTIHKSQGSEFAHCAMVLPSMPMPVLTKELIYTGITRAKKKLTLLGKTSVIEQSLKKNVQRSSGLKQRLWNATEGEPLEMEFESKSQANDHPLEKSRNLNSESDVSTDSSNDSSIEQSKDSPQQADDKGQFSLF